MADIAKCELAHEVQVILATVGVPNMTSLLIASSTGCVFQALYTGSCLQLLHSYFTQPKRDTLWARVGVVWIAVLCVTQMVFWNTSNINMILQREGYTSIILLDWWLLHLSIFLSQLIVVPVLLCFLRRVYHLWDRSKTVLFSCLALIGSGFIVNVVYVSWGMYAPWGLHYMSLDEANAARPLLLDIVAKTTPLALVGSCLQLASTILLCVLMTLGLLRHRNGSGEMNSAISRIAYLCSESLIPAALICICLVVAFSYGLQGLVLLRIAGVTTPSIYFHGLMNALVSRERVQRILQAEPVRQLREFNSNNIDDLPSFPDRSTISAKPLMVMLKETPLLSFSEMTPKSEDESRPIISQVSPEKRGSATRPGLFRRFDSKESGLNISVPDGDRRPSEYGLQDFLARGPE